MGKSHTESAGSLVLFLSLLLYLSFCFYGMNNHDLVNVELLTSEAIRKPWTELLLNRLQMGHPPLYFLLAKLWVTTFGHELTALYLFSMVLGALGIPLIYLLAKTMDLGQWSLAAPLLWATHPSILYYARYLRPQMGVTLLVMLYLLILLKKPVSHKGLLLLLGVIGALWSNLFVFFWLGILSATLLLPSLRRHTCRENWFLMISALVTQCVVCALIRNFTGPVESTLGWIKPVQLSGLLQVLAQALGGVAMERPLQMIPMISGLAFVAAAIQNRRSSKWRLLLASSVGMIALLLGTTLTLQPLWVPRYLVIFLPAVLLTTVSALAHIPWRLPAIACAGMVMAAGSFTSLEMIRQRPHALRDIVKELDKYYDPTGDIVMVLSPTAEEALRVYTARQFRQFLLAQDDTLKLFEEKTAGSRRLWVLEFPRKAPLLYTKQWKKRFKPMRFFDYRIGKTALRGYSYSDRILETAL